MRIIAEGLYDLCEWRPKLPINEDDYDKILKSIVSSLALNRGEVRTPAHNFRYGLTISWHRDGFNNDTLWLIVWSNGCATEIRPAHKKADQMITLQPCHIYLFDNTRYLHRTPKTAKRNPMRWFARSFTYDVNILLRSKNTA